MGIVTVTLNPALDKTGRVDDFGVGQLNRLSDATVDAGGKGINVSKMIASLGGSSLATGFVGDGSGMEIVRALERMDISHDFIEVRGVTRTNLKIIDRRGQLTEVNEPGPEIGPEEMTALFRKVEALASPETLFVFSGSLPAGVDHGVYAELIRLVRRADAIAYLDADGDAFARAVGAGPNFCKPNRFELLQYFGVDDDGDADLSRLAEYCRRLLGMGVGRVALSMGGDGALFVSKNDTFFCPAIAVDICSSVGAGDSMVGGVAYGHACGMPWRDTARLAMAASAGAVTTVGTKPPAGDLVAMLLEKVEFRDV